MTDAELPHRSTGPSGVEQAAEPSSLTAMTLRWIGSAGIRRHDPSESHAVLDRTDGFWRLDIPVWPDDAERLLRDEMNCHPLAIKLEEAQRLSAGARYSDRLLIGVAGREVLVKRKYHNVSFGLIAVIVIVYAVVMYLLVHWLFA